jgi:hypothetical protein
MEKPPEAGGISGGGFGGTFIAWVPVERPGVPLEYEPRFGFWPAQPGTGGGGRGQQSTADKQWAQTLKTLRETTNTLQYTDECLGGISALAGFNDSKKARDRLTQAGKDANFLNGSTSTRRIRIQLPGQQSARSVMIKTFLEETDYYAVAQEGGRIVYWQSGWERDTPTDYLQAAIMHELLHNIGFTDDQLFNALGITSSPNTHEITAALQKLCFSK